MSDKEDNKQNNKKEDKEDELEDEIKKKAELGKEELEKIADKDEDDLRKLKDVSSTLTPSTLLHLLFQVYSIHKRVSHNLQPPNLFLGAIWVQNGIPNINHLKC